MSEKVLRFVTRKEIEVEEYPHCTCEWLCRVGLVEASQLQLVRAVMPPGKAHEFHLHPECEEILYILEGEAEQWVDRERKTLGPGEAAHVPKGVVHATYNRADRPLVFLAMLSPATRQAPECVDVYDEEPWCSLRRSAEPPV
ncbi:MAG: cupin domain-containing protein [Planctomycetota bacterium]